jgi:AraC-like DNA-binding protein
MAAASTASAAPGSKSFDQSRPEFSPYGFTCERWRPTPMARADRHNELELNLVPSGAVTYLLGGRRLTVPRGRLSAFWAAVPHQIVDVEGEEDYFVATLPLSWVLECGLPGGLTERLLQGQLVVDPEDHRLASDRALFTQWERDLGTPGIDRRRVVLLEMEARLLRLAEAVGQAGGGGAAGVSKGQGTRVERMAFFIATHYTEKVAVEDIARAVGLHPNYAMTLFHKAFGMTLLEYLTHHRISHAQRLLITTDQKVLDVALSSGFNSISRFNAAFAERCGCSPREYRLQHKPRR